MKNNKRVDLLFFTYAFMLHSSFFIMFSKGRKNLVSSKKNKMDATYNNV